MASLRTLVKPHRRAAARFVSQTRRKLQRTLARHPEIKRSTIADELGVHRSVITRHLNGTQDMTMGRVAELAWAMGYEPELVLHDNRPGFQFNEPLEACPAFAIPEINAGFENLSAEPVLSEFELA